MKKRLRLLKRMMIVFLILIAVLVTATYWYLRRPQFGAVPGGERLTLIQKSKHYKDGRFRNVIQKPLISEGYSLWKEMYKSFFKSLPRRTPVDSLPSVKTDLRELPADSSALVWFGHSSFFIQTGGIKILVDPVFSGNASPMPWGVKAFKGSDIYTADDMPDIDYLLISHDHYDHLDYKTIKALKGKVKQVICGLGVGAHFERWGYSREQIIEKDWEEEVVVKDGFSIFTEPTQHDSGRGFARGTSLWLAFFIQAPGLNIYYSGDGGHDERFMKIKEKFVHIDWAIMECGQYNKAWQYVHELPEEVIKATQILAPGHLLPVHHSKFALAHHPWDEPLEELTHRSEGAGYQLCTPLIGETVWLQDSNQQFSQWWKLVK